MFAEIKDILKHTRCFREVNQFDDIEKISSNKYKVRLGENIFVFSLLDLDEYEKLENEAYINDQLENAGLNPLKIYDMGLLPDIEKSYKLYEYREEISLREFLDTSNKEDQIILALKFAKALKNLHSIRPPENIDWQNIFLVKTNNIFYKHGLSQIDEKDYILTDYIKVNRHLTENTSINLLYTNLNDKNIRVYDKNKLDLRSIKKMEYGDGISDFVEINKIAIQNPIFSKAVLEGYFSGKKPSRKFFKLLSLYQASAILESMIDLRNNKESYLKADEIYHIMQMYDDFNEIQPSWYR
uniref:kanamycin kinase n=1 Tax=Anaerococcus mediterraneensis TaxID=1870984 RepID=UPI0009300904|nr:kanamycin kinase [Anaerococcus mediterraneensis]